MAAQLKFDMAGRDENSEAEAYELTLLQIIGEKVPAGLVDGGAASGDRSSSMIIIGTAEALNGEEKRYSCEHCGWNPPLKIVPAILRGDVS